MSGLGSGLPDILRLAALPSNLAMVRQSADWRKLITATPSSVAAQL